MMLEELLFAGRSWAMLHTMSSSGRESWRVWTNSLRGSRNAGSPITSPNRIPRDNRSMALLTSTGLDATLSFSVGKLAGEEPGAPIEPCVPIIKPHTYLSWDVRK